MEYNRIQNVIDSLKFRDRLTKRKELSPRPPNCPDCGRFMRKNWDGLKYTWRCPKVFYDDYQGGWTHD